MKNFKVLLLYVFIGYVLPLLPKPELLLHYKILMHLALCVVMLLWANPPLVLSEGRQKQASDKGTLLLIFVLGFVAMLAPIIEWAYFKTDTGWTVWTSIGLLLTVGGLSFRIWSLRVLGKYFTGVVQQVEGHQLVTSGPYQWLRHPSYLGSWVAFLGCAVFLEAWLGLIITFLAMGTAYFFRISAEETTLENIFGAAYRQYRLRTWRLVPFVW
jgi:protein-S-isoprenylcysteine O-methyltransferase Ste14